MNNSIIVEDVSKIVARVDLSELKNKKILITGATGLMGTYFIYYIIEAAKEQIVPEKLTIIHLQPLPKFLKIMEEYEWIEILCGDLSDNNFIQTLEEYDYIIHFAGYGQPAKFNIDQAKTIKLNTTLTMELLERLKQNGKFLFASSSGIYNGLVKESYKEEDVGTTNTLHPRACYIEGKRCGEAIINAYRAKGINAKSARISYTYGPGVRKSDERALYSFIKKGLQGVINLLDNGDAQRIYCYVADVVELLWNILLFGKKPIYNVGGIEKITILELAQKIASKLEAQVILPKEIQSIQGNAVLERLNMEHTLEEFPMEFLSLDDGLARTIQWYKKNY